MRACAVARQLAQELRLTDDQQLLGRFFGGSPAAHTRRGLDRVSRDQPTASSHPGCAVRPRLQVVAGDIEDEITAHASAATAKHFDATSGVDGHNATVGDRV